MTRRRGRAGRLWRLRRAALIVVATVPVGCGPTVPLTMEVTLASHRFVDLPNELLVTSRIRVTTTVDDAPRILLLVELPSRERRSLQDLVSLGPVGLGRVLANAPTSWLETGRGSDRRTDLGFERTGRYLAVYPVPVRPSPESPTTTGRYAVGPTPRLRPAVASLVPHGFDRALFTLVAIRPG